MTSPTESPAGRRGRFPSSSGALHTRISWAWATLFVGVALGIALVDFLAQNTRSVRIEFFSASGHVPVAVALLVAALAGAALVLIVGVARMGQLRHGLRSRDVHHREMREPASEPDGPTTQETEIAGETPASGRMGTSPSPPAGEPASH
jgi:uncharacterized integral membrane protein